MVDDDWTLQKRETLGVSIVFACFDPKMGQYFPKLFGRFLMNLKLVVPIMLLVFSFQGCAVESDHVQPDDNRPCMVIYTQTGSLWTGRSFKTSMDFPQLSRATAFSKINQAIATHGYVITAADKENGVISGNSAVFMGHGKVVPLNAIVNNNPSGGASVELVFHLSPGLAVGKEAVQKEFCSILESVNR